MALKVGLKVWNHIRACVLKDGSGGFVIRLWSGGIARIGGSTDWLEISSGAVRARTQPVNAWRSSCCAKNCCVVVVGCNGPDGPDGRPRALPVWHGAVIVESSVLSIPSKARGEPYKSSLNSRLLHISFKLWCKDSVRNFTTLGEGVRGFDGMPISATRAVGIEKSGPKNLAQEIQLEIFSAVVRGFRSSTTARE